MRSKYKHFRTIREQTFDISPTDPISSSLNLWSSMHGVATLTNCRVVLFASSQYLPRLSWHDLPYHRTMKKCLRQVSQSRVAFLSLQQRFWIQTLFCNCPQYLYLFDILVECNPRTVLVLVLHISTPILELSPNRVSIGFYQIAFPIIVLPEDDRTDSVQEERLGLRYRTIIWALLCFCRRIQISGHSDFGIFNKKGASSILTWV